MNGFLIFLFYKKRLQGKTERRLKRKKERNKSFVSLCTFEPWLFPAWPNLVVGLAAGEQGKDPQPFPPDPYPDLSIEAVFSALRPVSKLRTTLCKSDCEFLSLRFPEVGKCASGTCSLSSPTAW